MHMPRLLNIFQRQGINVIPAPTDFLVSQGEMQELGGTPKAAILSLLPDTDNLHQFTKKRFKRVYWFFNLSLTRLALVMLGVRNYES